MRLITICLIIFFNLQFALAGTYKFNALYQQLGYPSENYFGATAQEIESLETYTSKEDTFYKEINSYLRYFPKDYDWNGISPADAKIIVKDIDHIFNRTPILPNDLILFRGVDLKFRDNKSFTIGEEIIEKSYISTSTTFDVAKYFAIEINNNSTSKSRKAIFTYYTNQPKLRGILIDQGEDEVILQHGEKVRIMAIKTSGTRYDLYLAQICGITCEAELTQDLNNFWKNFKD